MSSPPMPSSPTTCHLLQLPRELRDRIYKNLLSIKHTKTPKDVEAGLRSSTRYDWNIDATILRVNRQIRREAREVLGRENKFVVIERTPELEPRERDMKEEKPAIMIYNVKVWPGKKVKTADVPGERMRVRITKGEDPNDHHSAELDIYVVLVDELRDVCAALSIQLNADGTYRTSGLSARVGFVDPIYKETPQEMDNTRTALLQPLTKLRHFADVAVEGMPRMLGMALLGPMLSETFDGGLVIGTVRDLVFSGDQARDKGHFDVATAYYQRAHEYFHHCAKHEADAFNDRAEPLAIEFKLMQHRALNWIEDDNFEDAKEAAGIALHVANLLLRGAAANDPNTAQGSGPRRNARGIVTKAAFRSWSCQCIKEGAERVGHRIKAEDVGRVYYYKSIAGHLVGGSAAKAQADEDKLMGIGCCVVSDTVGEENVPRELMELEMRTMERLRTSDRLAAGKDSEDEWEDEEEDDKDEEGDAVDWDKEMRLEAWRRAYGLYLASG